MSKHSKGSKESFIKFVLSAIEPISEDREIASDYLRSEGLNENVIASEGIRRIRSLKLRIQAVKSEKEMVHTECLRKKAVQWVEKLMSDAGFSFSEFVAEEKLSMHNRAVDSLTEEEVKKTLIQYFVLKFVESEKGTKKD